MNGLIFFSSLIKPRTPFPAQHFGVLCVCGQADDAVVVFVAAPAAVFNFQSEGNVKRDTNSEREKERENDYPSQDGSEQLASCVKVRWYERIICS